ncbi:hypothetical protein, partial [Azospirillum brasilense]|uniref:hypothetical protein n=1 Tax=Azospirillum brasilense TaxID=192 RepID=UPI001B3BE723
QLVAPQSARSLGHPNHLGPITNLSTGRQTGPRHKASTIRLEIKRATAVLVRRGNSRVIRHPAGIAWFIAGGTLRGAWKNQ